MLNAETVSHALKETWSCWIYLNSECTKILLKSIKTNRAEEGKEAKKK